MNFTRMIFSSHFISMIVFAAIVSIVLGFIRFDHKKDIFRYALKLFIYMSGAVVVGSWIMKLW